MNRPLHTWIAFTACLAVVLIAMGWISTAVLRLERTDAQSRRQAEQEENVRLALWRLDSALSPVIAEESVQPWYAYQSYYLHGKTPTPAKKGDIPVFATIPSPLLIQRSPHIRLHFQIDDAGELTSPQVIAAAKAPVTQAELQTSADRTACAERLAQLRTFVTRQALAEKLPDTQNEVQYASNPGNVDNGNEQNPSLANAPPGNDLAQNGSRVQKMVGDSQGEEANQKARSQNEYQMRSQLYQVQKTQQYNSWSNSNAPENTFIKPSMDTKDGYFKVGIMTPLWIGPALVLARRVHVGRYEYIQGCWLDWPELQGWLRTQVADLLPNATFEAASSGPGDRPANLLAALPVRVVAGPLTVDDPSPLFSPLRISLIVAWLCVLLAAGAVGALLMGAMSLSERRGAFVSAVTHELRTPLTTFRLYTEMLSEQMVPDEATRRKYVDTLRIEADRLSHLVENVLAYAQLERGRMGGRMEDTTWQNVLATFTTRLSERAAQAGMTVVVDAGSAPVAIRTDPSAVEQILFNMVDNACKYASNSGDKTIHLEVLSDSARGRLRIRDHGPGFSTIERQSLFQPFSKSARQAAHSAPGVGLGLALSRRLARQMGGELSLDTNVADGACFILTLPAPR